MESGTLSRAPGWAMDQVPRSRLLRVALRAASPTPKIAPVLVLIALIVFGVGVIAVAGTVLLLRSAPAIKARQARNSDRELAESEVYKKLYGKRSLHRIRPNARRGAT